MATIPSSSLQFSNSFTLASPPPNSKPNKPKPYTFTVRASDPDAGASPSDPEPSQQPPSDDDDFEDRLSKVRLRYRSGTGKKAELRKARKNKGSASSSGSGSGSSVYLPPVPLKEAISGGLKVDSGFTPFSERINGRIAILGLSALILVELATGKGVINYHTPAIILIQVYFVAAVGALYIKYEKEKVSVWPQSSTEEAQNL